MTVRVGLKKKKSKTNGVIDLYSEYLSNPFTLHPNQTAKYLEKKKKNREKLKGVGPDLLSTPRERERDRKGQGMASTVDVYGARRSARSSSGGQRSEGWWVG